MTTNIDRQCKCRGPGNYDHECPVGIAPHFVRAVSSPADHDLYIKVTVQDYNPAGQHSFQMFLFDIENDDGAWSESFGSREAADAFMNGMKVALAMCGHYMLQHNLPKHSYRPAYPPMEEVCP